MLIKSNAPEEITEEPVYDLSRLDAEAKVAREHLIALGKIGYGGRWQAPLARDLSSRIGAEVSRAQVNHWVSGERPVPLHVRPELAELGFRISQLMLAGSKELSRLFSPPKRKRAPASRKPKED